MALALIPEKEIPAAYQRIKMEGRIFFEKTPFESKLEHFFSYFEKEWLNGIFKISEWCVFGKEDHTNNFLESYHSQLKTNMGLRPTVPNFISESINLSAVWAKIKSWFEI